jgi:hypothetical protein
MNLSLIILRYRVLLNYKKRAPIDALGDYFSADAFGFSFGTASFSGFED